MCDRRRKELFDRPNRGIFVAEVEIVPGPLQILGMMTFGYPRLLQRKQESGKE